MSGLAYDLYMSLGSNCKPAMNLDTNYLRTISCPLDWMRGYSIDVVGHLFETAFSDYFEDIREDIEHPNTKDSMRSIWDVRNHIESIHDFPMDKTFTDVLPEFRTLMMKRIERMKRALMKSKKVVLLASRNDTTERMLEFLFRFSKVYPYLEIRLINVRHLGILSFDEFTISEKYRGGGLSYYEYFLNDSTVDGLKDGVRMPEGNQFAWSGILSEYENDTSNCIRQSWTTIRENENMIVLYGTERRCLRMFAMLRSIGVIIDGVSIDGEVKRSKSFGKVRVDKISAFPKDSLIVVCDEYLRHKKSIKEEFEANGIKKSIWLDNRFLYDELQVNLC